MMSAIHAKRRVHHSAQEMFDLVADVERYPEFVPHCQRHVIVARKANGKSEVLITDMTIARGPFRETIRSRDTLDRGNGRIRVEAVGRTLQRLQTLWTFQAQGGHQCDVGFDIAYEFSSLPVELLLGSIFDSTFRHFVQAFERRADVLYSRHRGCGSANSSA
jgi:coenzyme Q-binding protein COQ10